MEISQVVNDIRFPFQKSHLDNVHARPFYISVCIDFYSGFVEMAALASEKLEDTIEATTKLLLRMQLPEECIVDNARTFRSEGFKELCLNLGVTLSHTTPRNNRSNGKVERVNRVIQERLRNLTGNGSIPIFFSITELDTILSLLSFEINNTKVKGGFAPNEIIRGTTNNLGLRLPPRFSSSENGDYV